MRKARFIIVFVFLFQASRLVAQKSSDTIVLAQVSEAIAYAKKHNIDKEIQSLQNDRSKSEYRLSKSYLLPNISGNFNAQNNLKLATTPIPGELVGQPGTLVNVQFGQDYNYNAGVTVTQTVLDWQNSMKSRTAKVGTQITQVQSELFDERLTEQIALYYYTSLIAQKALDISTKDLALADSILILTQEKFQNGLVDKSIWNQASINLNNIQQNLLSNRILWEQSLNQLKNLLGIPTGVALELHEAQSSFEHAFSATNELSMDKNIHLLALQSEQARLDIKQQRALYYPKLTLNAYFGQQQFQNDFTFSLDGNAWSDYSYVGLNVSVPIFTGFANHQKIKIAKIEKRIVDKSLEQEKRESILRDDLLLKEHSINLDALTSAHNNYLLYEDNVSLAHQKLQQGIISLETYFKVFEDYLKSENNYLNALSNLYSSYSTILSRKNDNNL